MGKPLRKVIDGEVCGLARWTQSCSGCYDGGEYGGNSSYYPWDPKAQCRVGAGCHECGYTGKRRIEMWQPLSVAQKGVEGGSDGKR